jgi:hypothetical protein
MPHCPSELAAISPTMSDTCLKACLTSLIVSADFGRLLLAALNHRNGRSDQFLDLLRRCSGMLLRDVGWVVHRHFQATARRLGNTAISDFGSGLL